MRHESAFVVLCAPLDFNSFQTSLLFNTRTYLTTIHTTCLQPTNANRQTVLFSATVPASLKAVLPVALKSDHQFLDLVGETTTQTSLQVAQTSIVSTFQDHIPLLLDVIRRLQATKGHKIIVFFTTARVTGLMAMLVGNASVLVVFCTWTCDRPHGNVGR
jgi:superfamily II DNA/RNA helicase